MKRFTLALVFAVVAICGVTTSTNVSAQEILLEGPLAGAPAVRKIVQYRELRFSVGPQFAYNILSEYMHNFLLGVRLEFSFLDWLGLGIVGYYSLNFPTRLTDHITNSENLGGASTGPADSNWPSYTGAPNFEEQVSQFRGMYLAQLDFVPFRGKMSMFEKLFVAIDGTIFVGGGIVHYEERPSCDGTRGSSECGPYEEYKEGTVGIGALEPDLKSQVGGAFTLGVGFMAYFNNWFAVNLEFRLTPFKWNPGGSDEAGQSASVWEYVPDESDTSDDTKPKWEASAKGSGDYPDGKIGEEDRVWNANMSIALGFIFYFPLDPSVSD